MKFMKFISLSLHYYSNDGLTGGEEYHNVQADMIYAVFLVGLKQ